MLNISLEIHQDGKDAESQARGVVAALLAIYGDTVLPASAVRNVVNQISAPAPDGYPTQPPAPADEDDAPADSNAPGVDKDGVPWDERIHSSNRKLAATGLWMKRRGVEDDVYARVTAELKGAVPPPAPPAPAAAEVFTPAPAITVDALSASISAAPPMPPAAPVPVPPAPAVPAPATGDTSFLAIMKRVTAAQAAGKIDKPKLDALLAAVGVESVAKLVAAPEDQRANLCAVLDSEGL